MTFREFVLLLFVIFAVVLQIYLHLHLCHWYLVLYEYLILCALFHVLNDILVKTSTPVYNMLLFKISQHLKNGNNYILWIGKDKSIIPVNEMFADHDSNQLNVSRSTFHVSAQFPACQCVAATAKRCSIQTSNHIWGTDDIATCNAMDWRRCL